MTQTFLLATAIYIVVIAATILLHYESLRQLSLWLPRLSVKPQLKVVIGLSGALLAHILEVWLFAVAYYVMVHTPGLGSLEGNFDGSCWTRYTFRSRRIARWAMAILSRWAHCGFWQA